MILSNVFTKKNTTILVLILWLYYLVPASDRNFDIKIQVNGIKNDTAILAYYYENNKYIQDSIYFNEKGIATLKGKKNYANGVYLIAFPKLSYKSFDFIIKETQFSLSTDTANLGLNMKVSNSLENKALYSDVHFAIKNVTENDSLNKLLAQYKETDANYINIKKLIEKNRDESTANRQKIIANYPNTLYASLLKIMLSPIVPENQKKDKEWIDTAFTVNYIRDNYFHSIDFNDSSYVRSPVFKTFIYQYFDNYIFPVPDSIITYADKLIALAEKGSPLMYRYILNILYDKYSKSQIMGYDRIFVHLAEQYYLNGKAPWSDEENLKKVKNYIEDIKPTLIGNIAPNFSFRDVNLNAINFYSLLDKNDYTVLLFWNSDCGHCKKEVPILKSMYDSLKNIGTQVIAISSEQTDSTFKQFAKENCHQDWIVGWDPYGTSAFRREYNVVTTPRVFIIDKKEKKIRAKNLPTKDIYGYIEFLKKNEK